MVFYRTYRPQKIEDLDNEMVRQSLYAIFAKSNFPHAFLFTGPKGLGKTSAARIVAKIINCEKHKNLKGKLTEKEIEPDNKCKQCTSITNGNNLDVLEIDGASNRGIDEIRDLKEKINLSPFKASKKIYIIDEVHMLTTEAFNALLKTLEEPPSHAVFVLCTTEPQKVPETIASRCFKVNFTRATNDELVRSLTRIIKAEQIKVDSEALLEIANLSDGSFRDGTKILEEVSVFSGKKTITKDLVDTKYNTLGISKSVSEMLLSLEKKDVKKGLLICRELTKQGMDFKFFIEQLIQKLHSVLLFGIGIEKSGDNLNFSPDEIKKLFELLSSAYQETKNAILPQVPLEIAILEWANEKKTLGLSQAESYVSQDNVAITPLTRVNPKVNGQASSFFAEFIDEVKNHNHLVAGVLRSCTAEAVLNGKLNIMANSRFHKEKLEETKTLSLLEEAASKILGKKVEIYVFIKGGEK